MKPKNYKEALMQAVERLFFTVKSDTIFGFVSRVATTRRSGGPAGAMSEVRNLRVVGDKLLFSVWTEDGHGGTVAQHEVPLILVKFAIFEADVDASYLGAEIREALKPEVA